MSRIVERSLESRCDVRRNVIARQTTDGPLFPLCRNGVSPSATGFSRPVRPSWAASDGRRASICRHGIGVPQGQVDVVQALHAAASGCSRRCRTAPSRRPSVTGPGGRGRRSPRSPGRLSMAAHSRSTSACSTLRRRPGRPCRRCRGRCRRSATRRPPGSRSPAAPTPRARATSRCRSPGPATRIVAPCGVGLVEHEVRVVAPGGEQPVLEAGAGDPLQVDGRDDLVGVDVGAAQRRRPVPVWVGERLHVRPSPGRGRR